MLYVVYYLILNTIVFTYTNGGKFTRFIFSIFSVKRKMILRYEIINVTVKHTYDIKWILYHLHVPISSYGQSK